MEFAGYISNGHTSLELCVCLGEVVALGCAVSVRVYGEIRSIPLYPRNCWFYAVKHHEITQIYSFDGRSMLFGFHVGLA